MPLRDHFRSPVNDTHSWDELHGGWPGEMVRHLKRILPAEFRAAPRVHLGSDFEPDLDSYERETHRPADERRAFTIDADLSDQDEYEVRIYDTERGRQLVAAIEIVSPANKDRTRTRDLLTGKVAALLQQDVCVSIVDLVTVRRANVYADLLTLLGRIDPQLAPTPPHLYAVSLRTRRSDKDRPLLDAWFYPMTVGEPLPTLPIWLNSELQILLPLETSYQETCSVLGIA